jgi:DNA-binding protein YbaB
MEDITSRLDNLAFIAEASNAVLKKLAAKGYCPIAAGVPLQHRPRLHLSNPGIDLRQYALNSDVQQLLEQAFARAIVHLENDYENEYNAMLDGWAGPTDHLQQLAVAFEGNFRMSSISIRQDLLDAVERRHAEQAYTEASNSLKVSSLFDPNTNLRN